VLSEHNCHGWLDGYTLTGRHGMFASYEAFGMVSASMTMQQAKRLQEANHLEWRAKVPSTIILLSSTCWRNDHNGSRISRPSCCRSCSTCAAMSRADLPAADANCLVEVLSLLPVTQLRQPDRAGQARPQPQWLNMDEQSSTAPAGYGIWSGPAPRDWVMPNPTSCSPRPAMWSPSRRSPAAEILKARLPKLKVRFGERGRLMTLYRPKDHPHGMSAKEFARRSPPMSMSSSPSTAMPGRFISCARASGR
jgi:xylulose-5-phosphate/fructose-6-phosphate phosphoketolase